jgi:hypothetical protein
MEEKIYWSSSIYMEALRSEVIIRVALFVGELEHPSRGGLFFVWS